MSDSRLPATSVARSGPRAAPLGGLGAVVLTILGVKAAVVAAAALLT